MEWREQCAKALLEAIEKEWNRSLTLVTVHDFDKHTVEVDGYLDLYDLVDAVIAAFCGDLDPEGDGREGSA